MLGPLVSLEVLSGQLAVCRLDADEETPEWVRSAGGLRAIIWTPRGACAVVDASSVPEGVECECGWSALAVSGDHPFDEVGIMASLARPLAEHGVGVFVISAFNTDYLLVKSAQLRTALGALSSYGQEVLQTEGETGKSEV